MTIDLPDIMTCDNEFHNIRLATGSMPELGSSKKIKSGSPHNAIAVLNFLLLPPLEK